VSGYEEEIGTTSSAEAPEEMEGAGDVGGWDVGDTGAEFQGRVLPSGNRPSRRSERLPIPLLFP
jgi:hypothetical protein